MLLGYQSLADSAALRATLKAPATVVITLGKCVGDAVNAVATAAEGIGLGPVGAADGEAVYVLMPVTMRTRYASLTYTLLAPSTDTPLADHNNADVAGPPSPVVPVVGLDDPTTAITAPVLLEIW